MTAWKPRGFTSLITSLHTHTHRGGWLIKLRGVSASAVCAEKLILSSSRCYHFCVCETSSLCHPEQRSHRPPVEVSRTCTLSHASCKSWVISEQWHWVVLYYRWMFAAVTYLFSVGTLKAFTAQFILSNRFIKSSLNASTCTLRRVAAWTNHNPSDFNNALVLCELKATKPSDSNLSFVGYGCNVCTYTFLQF